MSNHTPIQTNIKKGNAERYHYEIKRNNLLKEWENNKEDTLNKMTSMKYTNNNTNVPISYINAPCF